MDVVVEVLTWTVRNNDMFAIQYDVDNAKQ